MLRSVILSVANSSIVRTIATGGPGRAVALRFVAGEQLEQALNVVRELNRSEIDVSLDHLGENVTDLQQAKRACETYLTGLDRIERDALRANVSVKLTQMGLDVDADAAFANVEQIVAGAATAGTSVTLDMEDHRYTDRTIDACIELARTRPQSVGIAVQSYLHRTAEDLERLIEAGVHVRLCKGAYREPSAIAFQRRQDVDAAYARLAVRLLGSASYAMIATHDDRLIDHTIKQVQTLGRPLDSFEFQMLYGVRRELQRQLVQRGYRLRVYVPFGSEWYPYLMRRIAERPANIRFFVEALARA